jgi:hypothetical protein
VTNANVMPVVIYVVLAFLAQVAIGGIALIPARRYMDRLGHDGFDWGYWFMLSVIIPADIYFPNCPSGRAASYR